MLLADGQVQLTLCVGQLQPMLREQQFEADSVLLGLAAPWDRWCVKALARCCRRGATVICEKPGTALQALLQQSGFDVQDTGIRYAPHWDLKTSRESLRTQAAVPGTCAVIGAGLAGASVAAALARRGWQVNVLDAASAPAAGASGLPAGLMVPHVSADDSPRSRLSRAGLRLMQREAQRLLKHGDDWDDCGVLAQRLDGHPGLPANWPAAGREISRPMLLKETAPWRSGMAGVMARASRLDQARATGACLAVTAGRDIPGRHRSRIPSKRGGALVPARRRRKGVCLGRSRRAGQRRRCPATAGRDGHRPFPTAHRARHARRLVLRTART
jgi:tRNA 5-methylaminomethyl-2-thiouridine biosynthesis bifunctional protein